MDNEPINFCEIDSRGNYVWRICGGDEESKQKRGNLMRFSEDMYEALKKFEFAFSNFTIMAKGLPSQMMIGDAIEKARQAIAKVEGKDVEK